MTYSDENKQAACRWLALLDARRVEELCAMTAPTWMLHGGPPELPRGPEGVRALVRRIGPIDQTWTVEDLIAEGDRVVVRATNTCLQVCFLGLPSHGRWQTFTEIFIHRIVNGRMLETWRQADDLGRVFQLGGRIEPPKITVRKLMR